MSRFYKKQLNTFVRRYRNYVNDYKKRLNINTNKLRGIENDGNEEEIQKLKYDIKCDQEGLFSSLRVLNSIRMPFLEDIEERDNKDIFAQEVKEVIPNDSSLAFHGCGDINVVEDIIRSGGLYTQVDRGFYTSATSNYICICTKNDIKTALDYADWNGEYCVPYGALFVLAPRDELEKEKFLRIDNRIANGTKISATTISLNFHDEPDRLIAIITTSENLDRLKEVARENGLNDDLIVTHNEFIQKCKQKSENHGHTYS